MKRLYSTFLFFLLISTAQSQIKEIFRDDFKDNEKLWPIIDVEIASSTFENGNYVISCKRDKEKYLYLRSIYFDPYEDFSVESKLKLENGQADQSFGMVWGASDEKSYYSFEITSSGRAVVVESNNSEYKEIKVAENVKVNPINEYNVLKFSKAGSSAVFFLNDVKLFTVKITKSYGLFIGFVLNQKIKVAVDYISVRQDGLNIDVVDNSVNGYKKSNLGVRVNSQFEELMPVISPDGKMLYLTCKGHPGNIGIKNDDIWYAERYDDSTWSTIKNIGPPLNNNDNNTVISVSPDGNMLMVNGVYNADGTTEANGVSISYKTKNGWSSPKKVVIDNFYNYNEFSGYCLSADGNVLLTCIEREDVVGNLDIYVCFKKKDGSFTEPKNVGNVINTKDDDVAPFLAVDNVTMYYATKGKPGFGSTDIFVTKRLDDSWTKWSEPKNMGPEVNTTNWDGYFTITAAGDDAYLASYDNSYGRSDIFRMPVPPSARPNPVVLVAGKVVNPTTKEPMGGTEIEYYDLVKNKMVGKAIASPTDGTFKIVLPYGKIYSFVAVKDSFYSESNYLDLTDVKKYQEVTKNIMLAPIQTGQVIRLNNLFFDVAKTDLDPASFPEMDRLLDLLKRYPKMEIEISGHTDSDGNDEYNMRLSQQRADAVLKYLLSKKVDAIRLKSKGYGESKPCADNSNDFGKSLNRRVEFVILKIK